MADYYHSETYGVLTMAGVREKILAYLALDPQDTYRIIVGTDSEIKNGQEVDFVTAIVVHRVGSGGIYFWKRRVEKKKFVLRQRIYNEAALSLACAEEFLDLFKSDGISRYDLEIHVDAGNFGPTREMLAELVGMVRGSGYTVKTKPDSFGATKVADRHT